MFSHQLLAYYSLKNNFFKFLNFNLLTDFFKVVSISNILCMLTGNIQVNNWQNKKNMVYNSIYFLSKLKTMLCTLSHIRLFVNIQTVTRQAPLSIGFSRQEYWSGSPYPPPRDLHNQMIKLQADSLLDEPSRKPNRSQIKVIVHTE